MVASAPQSSPSTSCNPLAVPEAMRNADRWIGWKPVRRGETDTKVPISAHCGTISDVTDPSVHAGFHVAFAMAHDAGTVGVGFVFVEGEGWCGIDLDDCVDEHGVIHPAAMEIIRACNSHAETSPSGTGVKIFIRGTKPAHARCTSRAIEGIGKIEIYDKGRYFTVTGNRVPGTPAEVRDAQVALDDLCGRLWPPKAAAPRYNAADAAPASLDDDALVARIRRAANGPKFEALFDRGDTSAYAGDDSAADSALACILAFYTRDAAQIERIISRSALGQRDKWRDRQD